MDPQALKKIGGVGAVALAGVAGAIGLFNASMYNGTGAPRGPRRGPSGGPFCTAAHVL